MTTLERRVALSLSQVISMPAQWSKYDISSPDSVEMISSEQYTPSLRQECQKHCSCKACGIGGICFLRLPSQDFAL
ncbi:hypothetical protein MRB53_036979 [Persea americana]|nr:hypothetical protein MRB53_036979 [Persea americana]